MRFLNRVDNFTIFIITGFQNLQNSYYFQLIYFKEFSVSQVLLIFFQ